MAQNGQNGQNDQLWAKILLKKFLNLKKSLWQFEDLGWIFHLHGSTHLCNTWVARNKRVFRTKSTGLPLSLLKTSRLRKQLFELAAWTLQNRQMRPRSSTRKQKRSKTSPMEFTRTRKQTRKQLRNSLRTWKNTRQGTRDEIRNLLINFRD